MNASKMFAVAAMVVLAAGSLASAQVSRDTVAIRWNDSQIQIVNAKVTAVSSGTAAGNVAIVPPGATITVQAQYNISFSANPLSYGACPSCFIQNYLAWFPSAVAQGASPANVGLWDGDNPGPGDFLTFDGATSGTAVFTTTVPSTPGEYYIGVGNGLDFGFNSGVTATGSYDLSVGVVGAPVYAAFLVNVTRTPVGPCVGDASGDGAVNFTDITSVLANFGLQCP
jgi:hypothetical protein